MKNILLCDANFCVLPIVQSIMSKNHILSVVGSLLSDPAHHVADKSVPINYADVDLLHKHIIENKYDFIVPGCNDRSYLSLAEIAEKLNYSGFDKYETVLTVHHKDKFRAFAETKNYPVPKAVNDISKVNTLNFPIIIKPVDSFSGKGTNRVETLQDVEKYWNEAKEFSKTGAVVAEEFVEGKLYSHSAFIKNKKIVVDFFVNEYCTVYPYQVNSSNVASELNQKIQDGLREWTEQFAQDLDLVDGLVHTQFISDNKTFSLIEIARRCPGDLYSQLIEKSTGVNYAELYAIPFIGEELPDIVEKKENKFMSRHTVSVDKECIFISSGVNLDNKNIQNVQLKYSGQKMKPAPFDKSGIYFIEHNSTKEMEDKTEKLKDYIVIETLDISKKDDNAKL
ncbi:ATP-grasp domain-containing protein [Sulfurimonas xiamenensis]|uniref:ATP-grasp domain-containing protein n=1 Tax=Sulfurimonas xiamenensis TaxID=2590021 RepID=A0AAJ4DM07_9BACT|nr:ATP-grasp domain-containing protein [Sulfurimonas xiamenensis]QFR42550.1 ATP-grasp domain-containing protein [Sulfurimonas xiamenensis]